MQLLKRSNSRHFKGIFPPNANRVAEAASFDVKSMLQLSSEANSSPAVRFEQCGANRVAQPKCKYLIQSYNKKTKITLVHLNVCFCGNLKKVFKVLLKF